MAHTTLETSQHLWDSFVWAACREVSTQESLGRVQIESSLESQQSKEALIFLLLLSYSVISNSTYSFTSLVVPKLQES